MSHKVKYLGGCEIVFSPQQWCAPEFFFTHSIIIVYLEGREEERREETQGLQKGRMMVET